MTCLHACFLKSLLGRLNGPKHEALWPKLTPFFPRTVPQVTYPLAADWPGNPNLCINDLCFLPMAFVKRRAAFTVEQFLSYRDWLS